MGMPETLDRWDRARVLAIPEDGKRYELFDGALLVTPAPNGLHQLAISVLWETLLPFVKENALGRIFTSPADLSLGGEQLSQPDLFVMPSVPADPKDWSGFPDPILVIEVLSSATARFDRVIKRRRFQRAGIQEYWIVDLDAQAFERWRPGDERPEILDQRLEWLPAGSGEGLVIDLPEFFRSLIAGS
jgi:Uma2 family endonuclease